MPLGARRARLVGSSLARRASALYEDVLEGGGRLGFQVTFDAARVFSVSYIDSPAQTSGGRPLLDRRYVVVGELPDAMAIPEGRGAGYWPVLQLIKDWNNQPESRELMLAGGLPEGADATAAAKVAAVVHALCERDGHPVPSWVQQARSPVEVPLVPAAELESPYGQRLRQAAPAACHHHRVYFSAVTLEST